MSDILNIVAVSLAVLVSLAYAVYALGSKRIKSGYSRLATKYFGLRAAKWFAPRAHDSCNNCPSNRNPLAQPTQTGDAPKRD